MRKAIVTGLTLVSIAMTVPAGARSHETAATSNAASPQQPASVPASPDVQTAAPPAPNSAPVQTAAVPQAVAPPTQLDAPAANFAPTNGDSVVANPLGLRPSKPLALAQQPAGAPSGGLLKGIFGVVLIGGALATLWFKKRRPAPRGAIVPPLRVLRRTSIGSRSELLVIEADGQQLLLGVTPQNIQLLTTLGPVDEAADAEAPSAAREPRPRESSDADDEDDFEPRAVTRHTTPRVTTASIPRDKPNQGERFAALLRATGVDEPEPPSAPVRRVARPTPNTDLSPRTRSPRELAAPEPGAAAPRARRQASSPDLGAPQELEGQVRALATWAPRK